MSGVDQVAHLMFGEFAHGSDFTILTQSHSAIGNLDDRFGLLGFPCWWIVPVTAMCWHKKTTYTFSQY